jgi:hypothetical protein
MTENAMMIFEALVGRFGARVIKDALREARIRDR